MTIHTTPSPHSSGRHTTLSSRSPRTPRTPPPPSPSSSTSGTKQKNAQLAPQPPFSRRPTTPDPTQIIMTQQPNSNSRGVINPPPFNRQNPPPPPPRSPSKSPGGRHRANSFNSSGSGSSPRHNNMRRSDSHSSPRTRRRSRGESGEFNNDGRSLTTTTTQRSRSRSKSGEFDDSKRSLGSHKSRSSRGSNRSNKSRSKSGEFNESKKSLGSSSYKSQRSNSSSQKQRHPVETQQQNYRRTESGGSHRSRSGSRRRQYSCSSERGDSSTIYPVQHSTAMANEEEEDDGFAENGRGMQQQHEVGRNTLEDSSSKNCITRVFNAILCIFPKVEPLPWWTFSILTLWSAMPPTCFIVFFSQMGFGEQIYYTVAVEYGHLSPILALALAAFIFVLYMLDADEWKGRCSSIFLDLSKLVIVCGLVMLVLMIADKFPYGMICLFAIFQPLWLLALKVLLYDRKDTRVFVSWLSGPLFFVSILIASAWAAWVFADPDNEWNIVARMSAAERVECEPNYEDNPDCRKEAGSEETCFHVEKYDGKEELVFPEGCDQSCTNVYSDCLNGFILWCGPILISMCNVFLSFFCTFLRTEGARERDVLNFGVIWIFILFAMWVTTSLAGTAAGVTAALAALTLASFVASAVFLAVSFSKEERFQNASTVFERLREKYGQHLDVARGLFVVTCSPIILVYFGFSIINQFIRRCGLPCSQPPGEDSGIFTTRTRKQVDTMKSWDLAKVFTYAIYWGIAFMILQVLVANLTVVFLSWMIEKTATLGLAAVTGIMCAVGVMMFLLPPVPGVPVYLTLGIVLPAQGHELLGWVGSIAYSVGIGLLLKLFSSALQQKMIGQNLSHYVKVRQFVGINSTLMKAMRLVLGKDGLSLPKVSILIGGPDWPTSVLCGIMRLGLFQILLGTVPIVFLISPTCLTGALLYMASLETDSGNPEFPWAGTVSTITASVTAIVQFGSMIVAAYYLEQTADKRADDVEAIPDDREVKDADDKAAHLKQCYRDVTQWDALPLIPKFLIQASLACIVTSSYLVQLFSSLCFTPHSLTDSIDDNLDGKVSNIFLPLGWVAVALFCISIIFIYIFESWGENKAYKLANGTVVAASPEGSASGERFA